ncbi:PLD nuclease N-terminal domain-containing protein [Frigoribacterium sp. VKM Ac-2836]|uniref:PLD nuclease N-terminal domain-containing protein n=1 Tax=Frigoribacterium sp. VKM Ac-2836 TaxID=2739014 RepID=UPI001564A28A|nr:PLD nuclease N-terminal domain-containing protein [Frigoribacterium sp. VKM Ac-2836]NRD27985.1 PLDc_N domain-containing protein [Frigoribacterium sp. VKM Ac-2836]
MSFLLAGPLVAASEGQAVFFPASYNFAWAAAVVAVVAGVIWMIVTVVRSPLTRLAKALWIAVSIALPLVGVVTWLVLGRDARRSGAGSAS